MEWQDDTLDAEEALAGDHAFTLIHEAPAGATQGHKKEHKGQRISPVAEATRALQLEAFPELCKGEAAEQRLARAAAAAACWGSLSEHIRETLEGTDAAVFEDVLRWAQQSHRPVGAQAAGLPEFAGCQRLPTGLVLAGGVNSADHGHTFPRLAAFLRRHGCHAALLHPHSLGKAPGDAFGEVLRQMSGLTASKAEHMAALAQWHRDETGVDRQAPPPAAAAEAAVQLEAGSTDAAPTARSLRQRAAGGGGAATAEQLASMRRPLVVILEGTEGADVQCLRDFVLTASEAYQDVPLTLLLGLTTSASALHDLLPSEVTDRCMQLQHFKLASAISRLDSLVQQVLLGGGGRWPGLLFSRAIVERLTDTFLDHYYSTGCITQGLKVAALSHFQTQPLSFLAAAVLEGRQALDAACAGLAPATLAQARSLLGCRSAADVATAVTSAVEGWSRWAVGAQWLLAAAEAAGLRGQDHRPWKLIEGLLGNDFAAKQLPEMLSKLQPLLQRLEPSAVQRLVGELQQRAAAVHGGADAAAPQLQQLAAAAAAAQEVAAAAEQEAASADGLAGAATAAAAEAQPVGEPEAAGAAQGGGKQGKRRADRYHTKDSRNKALAGKAAQHAAAKAATSAAAPAAQRARAAETPGARVAACLAQALRSLLATPSATLPGAAVFTCRGAAVLDCLTAEPRSSLHLALTEPQRFLPGLPAELGFAATQDDACLAYSIFDQDPKCCNLADWYQAFAAVHASAGEQAGGRKRKAAVKTGKHRGGGDGAAEEGERQRAREVAARFSQATAELQYVGLIKPAKKRRGDYVQRLVHQPQTE